MLEAEGIAIERGAHRLFSGLDLARGRGGVTVVLGPNGAGKSSLILALAGLLPPAAGEIRLEGRPLAGLSRRELARGIAWQGELPPTEFGLTVAQRLRLAAEPALDAAVLEARVDSACRRLELTGLRERTLAALSGGERQRVELAALSMRDCPVWLLDEPTAHLDLRHQALALALLRREAAAGRAVVVVLHDLQQAAAVADDVVLLSAERVTSGPAAECLTPERLQPLFGLPLRRQGDLLAPDYGAAEEVEP